MTGATAVLVAPAVAPPAPKVRAKVSDPFAADPFAADRFTVDPAEWGDHGTPAQSAPPTPLPPDVTPAWRLVARLVLVAAVSLLAFHHSLASLLRSVASGSILVYVLAVPLLAALAAAARARRPGYQPGIGVRVVDAVLGVAVCSLALTLTAWVGPGLSGVYFVWRLDLLMLWVFLLGAHVLALGARSVARTWAFWAVLLLLWPFPMRLVNAATGSAQGGALVLVAVVLAVLAYGHRAGDPARWRVLGSAAVAAALLLAVGAVTTHPQHILWPPVAAALTGAFWWLGRATPAAVRPVPEHRVRGTLLALGTLGVAALVVLPAAPSPAPISAPTNITSLATGPIEIPGWATMTSGSLAEQRFFGNQSTWQRVGLRQGISGVGPLVDGRDIVVDLITTPRPQTLELYPVVTTYPMGTLSATPDDVVDLGHAVTGQLFRGHDSRRHIDYTLLTFSWRLPVDMSIVGPYHGPPAAVTQRLTLIAVDDRSGDAAFPEPGDATLDGAGAAFENAGSDVPQLRDDYRPDDARLLTDAATALVDRRLTDR